MGADRQEPQGVQALFSSSEVLTRRIIFNPATRADAHSSAPLGLVPLNPLVLSKASVQAKGNGPISGSVGRAGGHMSASSGGDLVLSWPGVRKVGAGLSNLGNTCFLNSVLQSLTYTPPLAAYLESGQHRVSCRVSGFCALCALEGHVKQALKASGGVVQPTALVRNLRSFSKAFRVGRQEDAHEFMRYLVEALHKSCMPPGVGKLPPEKQTSFIYRAFAGRLRSQVKCANCGFTSDTYDPFLDLSLEINRADSLEKALKRFTTVEVLDGDNKYKCSKCRKKVRAYKQFTIARASAVLTIQYKRFDGGFGGKIDKKVDFPTTLDLGPFLSPEAPRGSVPTTYSLYSVLVHAGRSTHSGHYYSFIKAPTGVWHVMDDSRVRQVSEKTVLDQRAYMLFYIRNAAPKLPNIPTPVQKTNAPEKTAAPVDLKQAADMKEAPRVEAPATSKAGPSSKQAVSNAGSGKLSVITKGTAEQSNAVDAKLVKRTAERVGATGQEKESKAGREEERGDTAQEDVGVPIERTRDDDERRASGTAAGSSMAEDEDYWDRYYSQHWVSVPPQYYYLLRYIPSARRYYMAKEHSVRKRAEWGWTLYELALEKKLERDESESESEPEEREATRQSKRLRESERVGLTRKKRKEEVTGRELEPNDGRGMLGREWERDEGLQAGSGMGSVENKGGQRESRLSVGGPKWRQEKRSRDVTGEVRGEEVAETPEKENASRCLSGKGGSRQAITKEAGVGREDSGGAKGDAQKRRLIASMLAELEDGAGSQEFVRVAVDNGRASERPTEGGSAQGNKVPPGDEGRQERGLAESGVLHGTRDHGANTNRHVAVHSGTDSNAGADSQTASERASEPQLRSEPGGSSKKEEVAGPGVQSRNSGDGGRKSKGEGLGPANGVIREPFTPGKHFGQYGFEVPAWDDVELSSPSLLAATQPKGPKGRYDDWDLYYDQGKQKKVKNKGLANGDYASFLASQGREAAPDVDGNPAANPFQTHASLKTQKVGAQKMASGKSGKGAQAGVT